MYLIVDSHTLIWNKIVNWNDMEEYIETQLGALTLKNEVKYYVLETKIFHFILFNEIYFLKLKT